VERVVDLVRLADAVGRDDVQSFGTEPGATVQCASELAVAHTPTGGPAGSPTEAAGAMFQLTLEVDDVDATCAELTERGVELLNGPMDRPWGIRTASFRDPGGHIWEIAHTNKG
jgi:catechol 2,3-dioxygenase-like lactoylglutathione lyase family enzyme